MDLRVTYDREADAVYIYLAHPRPGGLARSVEAIPMKVILQLDGSERLVGIEVLSARQMLPQGFCDRAKQLAP